MMDLVAPLVAPALSQKPAFVTYFVARGAPRPCYIPEGFDSLPYICYNCIQYILFEKIINTIYVEGVPWNRFFVDMVCFDDRNVHGQDRLY